MRATIATIFVIFLVRCEYSRAKPEPGMKEIGEFFTDSCMFGIKNVSTYLHDDSESGTVVNITEICDYVDPSTRIAFMVHGFISSANTTNMRYLAEELTKKNYMVIAINWSQGACTDGIPIVKLMQYPSAVQNTRDIGRLIARKAEFLIKNCSASLENMICIGHSLGSHVCGFAGKEIQEKLNDTIPLIIGADPASPLIDMKGCDKKLCKTDARRLAVIHTSSLGIPRAIGHIDLFFHNGWLQPQCDINIACSHTRSIDYLGDMVGDREYLSIPITRKFRFYESLPPYPSSNLTNCIIMKSNILDSNNPIQGQYYVFVNEDPPYYARKTFNCNNNFEQ